MILSKGKAEYKKECLHSKRDMLHLSSGGFEEGTLFKTEST